MKKNNAFYYLIAVLGILIFSAGLCVLGESIIQKINEQNWFLIEFESINNIQNIPITELETSSTSLLGCLVGVRVGYPVLLHYF